MRREDARAAVNAVIEELTDRSGFDWWWGDLDELIQEDILDSLTKIVEVF